MSEITTFYTPPVRSSANIAAPGQQDGAIAPGVNFFDLIFASLSGATEQQNLALTAKASAKAEDLTFTAGSGKDLAALSIDLTGLEITDFDLSGLDLSSVTTSAASPDQVSLTTLDAEGMKKFQAVLANLLQGLPAEQQPVLINVSGGKLKAALGKLEINAKDIDFSNQNLIAAGLSPEQLTELVQLVGENSEAMVADKNADLQAILIGIVKIVPDGENTQSIFLPRAVVFGKTEDGKTATGTETEISEEIAAVLNPLNVGGVPAPTTAPGLPSIAETIDADGTKGGKDKGGFDDVLKLLEQIQAKTAEARGGTPAPGLEQAIENQAAKSGPVNSTLGSSFSGTLGTMLSSNTSSGLFPEGLDWSQNAAISNAQVSSTAQLTSLVTQARDATQPHTATQFVAATLTRSAQNGESKNMTLRLDPPELGKIEIQMHFTKDKSVKTHMVFEKPETMLMMQRDSQTLERAMLQAGMDAGGNALSFELAGQDHAFHDERGGNDPRYTNRDGSESAEAETIETTMTWYVDEQTGMQHYNILA